MYQKNPSITKGIDWLIIWFYTAIVFFGIICIYSVEYKSGDSFFGQLFSFEKNYSKQFIFFCISLVMVVLVLLTDSKFFTATANLFYLAGLILMLLTVFVGKTVNGSKSWLPLGFMNLQPVELCKIFTSLALAKYLSHPDINFSKHRTQLIAAGIAFAPIVFSILQNETGLALIYFAFLIPMYREGLPAIYLVIGASLAVLLVITLLFPTNQLLIAFSIIALGAIYFYRKKIARDKSVLLYIAGSYAIGAAFVGLIVPFIFTDVFQKYQADRIFSLVGRDNPFVTADSTTALLTPQELKAKKDGKENYNVRQSKIAIGSGGLFGKGFLKGTQTQGDFVPEQHTDFIFTSVGENFGFLGSLFLMLLYLGLLMRIVHLAERQRSVFSRVYMYSVAAILFFHIAINISMSIGLAPVIGLTLPLMSYGGSSLLTFSVLLFILINLDANRQMVLR